MKKETGIKEVVYSNFDTVELCSEKLSQAKGGDYDVVIADDYIIEKAVEQKLVKTLDKEENIREFEIISTLYFGTVLPMRTMSIQFLTVEEFL